VDLDYSYYYYYCYYYSKKKEVTFLETIIKTMPRFRSFCIVSRGVGMHIRIEGVLTLFVVGIVVDAAFLLLHCCYDYVTRMTNDDVSIFHSWMMFFPA